tara:strand:- start:296 stop:715 length:420 start_codon:yes stop_codon:yes gene_type:complete
VIRLVLIGLTLGLVACEREAGPGTVPIAPPSPAVTAVHVRPVGNNGTVDLVAGQTLALEMKSGFEWREADAPTLLRREDVLWGPADTAGQAGATGADSWQVFVYRALGPGEETLALVEARPWEPDTITDRYTLTVRITL